METCLLFSSTYLTLESAKSKAAQSAALHGLATARQGIAFFFVRSTLECCALRSLNLMEISKRKHAPLIFINLPNAGNCKIHLFFTRQGIAFFFVRSTLECCALRSP